MIDTVLSKLQLVLFMLREKGFLDQRSDSEKPFFLLKFALVD